MASSHSTLKMLDKSKRFDFSFLKETKEGLLVPVFFQPHASLQKLSGVWNETELKISGQKAPEDGKANRELLTFLARELKIPKTRISLLSGQTSRHKIVQILGDTLILKKEVIKWIQINL